MALNDSVDWRADLGGGYRVALVQAGTFTSDAGTVFGPVPRIMWDRLVADEINEDWTLTQALNCLMVETPAGRVLVETGVGERMDERRRTNRGVRGDPIVPALRNAGFDPATVDDVLPLVDRAEWKRRQFAPGVKISPVAFGRDRRLPITTRWREEQSR